MVLTAVAAAVITVVGVVFSITILALSLASQQFGPRMMRNFVRDIGNQLTLGIWVATFVYSVLTLGAISGSSGKTFVPDISITVTEVLLMADVIVLIYFIHHIAKSIQLPQVVASIASDLSRRSTPSSRPRRSKRVMSLTTRQHPALPGLLELLDRQGTTVPACASGYLQFVGYGPLVEIAADADAVIRLSHRQGHFVVAGRPLARVWPPSAAAKVADALDRSHVTGPHRTLVQDPVFAIDQLVEIAIRALSPAVNDTFTALTCIDWLSAGLCRISTRTLAEGVYRDRAGEIRLVEFDPSYSRMLNRATDKIRQAARGMPAVIIRLLDSLAHVIEYTTGPEQRAVIIRQAEMILRGADKDIDEPNDLAQIRERFEHLIAVAAELDDDDSGSSGSRRRSRRMAFEDIRPNTEVAVAASPSRRDAEHLLEGREEREVVVIDRADRCGLHERREHDRTDDPSAGTVDAGSCGCRPRTFAAARRVGVGSRLSLVEGHDQHAVFLECRRVGYERDPGLQEAVVIGVSALAARLVIARPVMPVVAEVRGYEREIRSRRNRSQVVARPVSPGRAEAGIWPVGDPERDDVRFAIGLGIDDRVEVHERIVASRITVARNGILGVVRFVDHRVSAGRCLTARDVPHVLHVSLPGEPRRRELGRQGRHVRRIDAAIPGLDASGP